MPHILGSWTACLILFHFYSKPCNKKYLVLTKISDISLMRIALPAFVVCTMLVGMSGIAKYAETFVMK